MIYVHEHRSHKCHIVESSHDQVEGQSIHTAAGAHLPDRRQEKNKLSS
jgi:hypothetical protein